MNKFKCVYYISESREFLDFLFPFNLEVQNIFHLFLLKVTFALTQVKFETRAQLLLNYTGIVLGKKTEMSTYLLQYGLGSMPVLYIEQFVPL